MLALAITVSLGASVPPSYHGFAIVAVLALVAVDGALVTATGALAFARRPLDERESALRDVAYRRGFRLLGTALALDVVATFVGAAVVHSLSANTPSFSAIDNAVTGRGLVAIVELLVMVPTFMVAWMDVDHGADDEPARPRRRQVGGTALAGVAALGLWLLLPAVVPTQAVDASTTSGTGTSGPQGATCTHVVAGRLVGANFGATVAMRVEACWNGTTAFVWGDPAIPLPDSVVATLNLPAGAPAEAIDPDLGDLTSCSADTVDDFAAVTQTCSATVDAAGTLHYVVHAHVTPLPGDVGARDLTLALVITRDGHVLAAP